MLIKVLAPGFYARQDTKTPVKIGIRAMVANMVFNLPLVLLLAHTGLTLATTLSAYLNALWLFMGLRKAGFYQAQAGWGKWILRIAIANGVMVAMILSMNPAIEQWMIFSEWQRAMWMLALVSVGAGSYGVSLILMGVRLKDLSARTGA
jgi:putative peptidoglycan lipid II flippase